MKATTTTTAATTTVTGGGGPTTAPAVTTTRSPPSTPIRSTPKQPQHHNTPSSTSAATSATNATTAANSVGNTMAHRLRIQQLQYPIPTSMTLTAAMQLLLDHYDYVAAPTSLSSTTTTNKLSSQQTNGNQNPYQLNRNHQPNPSQNHGQNHDLNISVYLMDRNYLQNWLLWAWHQTVPPSEIQRTKEALHLAATQLGLYVPPHSPNTSNSNGSSNHNNQVHNNPKYSYHDPGPIDNTSLSLEGHPMILDYNVKVMNPKSSSNTYSSGITPHHHHTTNAIALRKILSASSAIPSSAFGTNNNNNTNSNNINHVNNKMRMIGIHSDNTTNRTSRNNSTTDSDFVDHHDCINVPEEDDNNTKQCIAVPESFYETLRQVHGVICDDYCTISFQPHPIVIDHHDDTERIILQHHIYHHHHPSYNNGNNRTSSSSLQQQQQQQASSSPRPIEFRRKVVRQIDYEMIHQQYRTQMETTSTLMEKLLIEEQREKGIIPMTLSIETYPVKLIYTIQNETDLYASSAASVATVATNNNSNNHETGNHHSSIGGGRSSQQHQLQPHGFVLVSSTTSVVDAFTAMMRITEPSKTSQSVRIWTKWNYEYGTNPSGTTTESGSAAGGVHHNLATSRPTKLGDGYELVDMDRLLSSRKNSSNNNNNNSRNGSGTHNNNMMNSPQSVVSATSMTNHATYDNEKMAIGEYVQMHYPASSSIHDQNNNNTMKEIQVIVETRRTVNSSWPRESLKLINRLQPGDYVDAQDVAGKWYEAVIKSVDVDYFVVHYTGWASKWDAKVPREYHPNTSSSNKKKQQNSHQGMKNDTNMNGKTIPNGGQHHPQHHSPIPPTIQYDNTKRLSLANIPPPPPLKESANSSSPSSARSMKVKPPAPLWSHSNRWREQLQVGDIVEVRDSSSLAERPKWYRGLVKKVGNPNDPIHDMIGGADLEEYSVHDERNDENDASSDVSDNDQQNDTSSKKKLMNGKGGDGGSSAGLKRYQSHDLSEARTTTEDDVDLATMTTLTNSGTHKTAPLILLHRTQQILVEVEQERNDNKNQPSMMMGHNNNDSNGIEVQTNNGKEESLTPQPPFRRWVNLYGEEICQYGTHLKIEISSLIGERTTVPPVTLTYELESNRKPVEIMKSHPMHGSGFMRESLRGVPPAPGSVGLHNLGNSCFLNSTVQCLNHIKPLTQYFLEDRYVKDLNKSNPLGSGGNVSMAYASLLKKIWAGNHSILVPRMLKQTVASFAPQFDNSYQHDSHEFCQFLMDGIHEDLNRVKKKPYVDELEGFGMKDHIAAIESWRKHLLRHDSIIVDHCQGMHRSHLTCPQCGRESIKFDVYSSISLPLAIEKNTTSIELEDCLEKFMEAEQLDERDAYYCPNCRRHVCALKLIALWTVPDILILHLKRFTFDTCMSSGSMLRSKIDNTVKFPVDGLDLTKQVLGPVDPEAPPIYNLFGVSEHIGPTANSGHYTATIRNSVDGQWYRCNDSHVGRTSGEATITGGAYLLFYQRAKGLSKWGGLAKAMNEMNINPYTGNVHLHDERIYHTTSPHNVSSASGNGPSPPSTVVVDKEGFTQVKKKKPSK